MSVKRSIGVAFFLASALPTIVAVWTLASLGGSFAAIAAATTSLAAAALFVTAWKHLDRDVTASAVAARHVATASQSTALTPGTDGLTQLQDSLTEVSEQRKALHEFVRDARPSDCGDPDALPLQTTPLAPIVRLVAEHVQTCAALQEEAGRDALTGLLNRPGMLYSFEKAHQNGEALSVVHIDLEGFQTINHHYGYVQGDALLCEVGRRLDTAIGGHGMVARIAGDEFVVLCPSRADATELLATRLVKRCSEPFELEAGGQVSMNARAGWAVGDADIDQQLLRHATFALHEARTRSGRIHGYDEETAHRRSEQRAREIGLRSALDDGQFVLYAQPIFDVLERRIESLEVLIRWRHPVDGLVEPDEFLPVAERCGLMDEIDRWVFRTVCRQARTVDPSVRFAVNLSHQFVTRADGTNFIVQELAETGVAAGRISVELKQGGVGDDAASMVAASRLLSDKGISVALEDFGTGYSSLSQLLQMSASEVKIDRALVSLVDRPAGRAVIGAIITYAQQNDLRVIAKGVLTADQSIALQELGCRYQQGFFHQHPAPLRRLVANLSPAADDPIDARTAVASA